MFKEHKVKDDIIIFLSNGNKKGTSNIEISNGLKLDIDLVTYCCNRIINDGYGKKIPISISGGTTTDDLIIILFPSGTAFVKFFGGYTKKYKKEALKEFPARYWYLCYWCLSPQQL